MICAAKRHTALDGGTGDPRARHEVQSAAELRGAADRLIEARRELSFWFTDTGE
jgi:hypothetical protein